MKSELKSECRTSSIYGVDYSPCIWIHIYGTRKAHIFAKKKERSYRFTLKKRPLFELTISARIGCNNTRAEENEKNIFPLFLRKEKKGG